ncbi:hypothetical protein CYMTET_24557 [Cymbomonas tetramitiformis]|uniref:Uncharacterized protein n=1 Tax=Cymbomonas tetramitiformis TaxID=36881 RepID=A0AAE0L048_9CHLO|nr:hypothetical protein CYMTET_24557 [Cymbomonas tetramitiformis]
MFRLRSALSPNWDRLFCYPTARVALIEDRLLGGVYRFLMLGIFVQVAIQFIMIQKRYLLFLPVSGGSSIEVSPMKALRSETCAAVARNRTWGVVDSTTDYNLHFPDDYYPACESSPQTSATGTAVTSECVSAAEVHRVTTGSIDLEMSRVITFENDTQGKVLAQHVNITKAFEEQVLQIELHVRTGSLKGLNAHVDKVPLDSDWATWHERVKELCRHKTLRRTGISISLTAHYDNMNGAIGSAGKPYLPAGIFVDLTADIVGLHPFNVPVYAYEDDQDREISIYALSLNVQHTGSFCIFDYTTLIATLTSSLGLIAFAHTITEYLMLKVLPQREEYFQVKYLKASTFGSKRHLRLSKFDNTIQKPEIKEAWKEEIQGEQRDKGGVDVAVELETISVKEDAEQTGISGERIL